MLKYLTLIFTLLCLFNLAAHAASIDGHKQELGLGLGAVIGGLLAGPPGIILGAAGGAWLGDRGDAGDTRLADLEQRLSDKQAELAYLRDQFTAAETGFRKVLLDNRSSVLDDLVRGVDLTLYFRTGQADPDPADRDKIRRLAGYLNEFPEIRVHLEGHADRRGSPRDNHRLSRLRAAAVAGILVNAGLDQDRILLHAHGEDGARAAPGDLEGYIFDRRVDIHLSIDAEA